MVWGVRCNIQREQKRKKIVIDVYRSVCVSCYEMEWRWGGRVDLFFYYKKKFIKTKVNTEFG